MSESNNNLSNNNKNSTNQSHIKRFESLINDLKRQFPNKTALKMAIVSVTEQKLYLIDNHVLIKSYLVSTAEAGTGNQSGSYQTPLGIHRISEKFGDNAALGSIFKARQNTHQIAEIILAPKIRSKHDNITSRILWLVGLEDGFNKGLDKDKKNVDSHDRYIYIHGTDEEGILGTAASHGCVRMANHDVIELFDNMQIDDLVVIVDN